ncbi:hypothetical protein JTI58_01685 [Lysinibacillus fusiformis]|uniref:hypothetical protein n=1 Tax=Lysinibacillus fusiformis TaxID=28031 RepID=UPI00196842ED|nr:hypothetical protein [Lysinibacillus fusiformis]QSB10454.1 hypothetical protein JTI58_01685 [Lysinibacillus fusiformis]
MTRQVSKTAVPEQETEIILKEKTIKKETTKLKKIFADLVGHQKEVALRLIDELAFLIVEIQELRQHVKLNGSVEEMQQGDYSINRRSPYFQNYLDAAKTYTGIYKQLLDMYPKPEQKLKVTGEMDGLQKFLSKHSK